MSEKDGLSFLVAFRDDDGTRTRPWEWVRKYWEHEFPDAEFIIGQDHGTPYSKATAINEAKSRATGGILIVMDADCYLDAASVHLAVDKLRVANKATWFYPFNNVLRLTREKTEELLAQDPTLPYAMPDVPPRGWVEDDVIGHGFMQIITNFAWHRVNGYDPRFRGWGGEDKAFWRAMNTLYSSETRILKPSYHLWHERIGAGHARTREWPGQNGQTRMNADLTARYIQASGDPIEMKRLTREV